MPAILRVGSDMPYDRATDPDSAADLRAEALRVRSAITLGDQEAADKLTTYADELEAQAVWLDAE